MNRKLLEDMIKELSFSYQVDKSDVKARYFHHLGLELKNTTFGDQEYFQRLALRKTEDDLRKIKEVYHA